MFVHCIESIHINQPCQQLILRSKSCRSFVLILFVIYCCFFSIKAEWVLIMETVCLEILKHLLSLLLNFSDFDTSTHYVARPDLISQTFHLSFPNTRRTNMCYNCVLLCLKPRDLTHVWRFKLKSSLNNKIPLKNIHKVKETEKRGQWNMCRMN